MQADARAKFFKPGTIWVNGTAPARHVDLTFVCLNSLLLKTAEQADSLVVRGQLLSGAVVAAHLPCRPKILPVIGRVYQPTFNGYGHVQGLAARGMEMVVNVLEIVENKHGQAHIVTDEGDNILHVTPHAAHVCLKQLNLRWSSGRHGRRFAQNAPKKLQLHAAERLTAGTCMTEAGSAAIGGWLPADVEITSDIIISYGGLGRVRPKGRPENFARRQRTVNR